MNWWVSVLGSLTAIIFVIYFFVKNFLRQYIERRTTVIHPDSADDVSSTRSQMMHTAGREERIVYGSDICSICLENFKYKIETNCGHEFCGDCFTSYWHVGNFVRRVNCPMCRSNVNLLIKAFSGEEVLTQSEIKSKIVEDVNCFNRLYSDFPRTWTEQVLDMPVILRHGVRSVFDGNSISIVQRLRLGILSLIVIGYCLSPLDIIPEAGFGVLGLLDDLLILATFLMYMMVFFRRAVGDNNV